MNFKPWLSNPLTSDLAKHQKPAF